MKLSILEMCFSYHFFIIIDNNYYHSEFLTTSTTTAVQRGDSGQDISSAYDTEKCVHGCSSLTLTALAICDRNCEGQCIRIVTDRVCFGIANKNARLYNCSDFFQRI